MKSVSLLPALAFSSLLVLTACQKSEKVEAAKVEPATEVKQALPPPSIPAGTWIGTMADGSDAAILTIDPSYRLTIVQQESPTSGTYSIDASKNPAVLSFTPDGTTGVVYTSQIQKIDDTTITMTSFTDATASVPPSVPPSVPQAAPAAAPAPAPFTGNQPPPPTYSAPTSTVQETTGPVFDTAILTVTFKKQ